MKKGFIFDLDGVIVHTDKYHYLAWKKLADEMGIYFDETINNRLRGVSRMESLEIILEKYNGVLSAEEKEAAAARKNEYYRGLLSQMTPKDVSETVLNTLRRLRERGSLLAIGSSSKNAGYILERVGLGTFFDAVSDGNNITHSKPDPEVFLKASQMLSLSPGDCVVVEDAAAGIQAGVRGGFETAAVGDAVKCAEATYKLTEFADLLKIG